MRMEPRRKPRNRSPAERVTRKGCSLGWFKRPPRAKAAPTGGQRRCRQGECRGHLPAPQGRGADDRARGARACSGPGASTQVQVAASNGRLADASLLLVCPSRETTRCSSCRWCGDVIFRRRVRHPSSPASPSGAAAPGCSTPPSPSGRPADEMPARRCVGGGLLRSADTEDTARSGQSQRAPRGRAGGADRRAGGGATPMPAVRDDAALVPIRHRGSRGRRSTSGRSAGLSGTARGASRGSGLARFV